MTKPSEDITPDEVNAAQEKWCSGLMSICARYIAEDPTYEEYADEFIDEMYDFDGGRVFFRPTLALAPQHFRTTREGCRAYFLGGDSRFPKDTGFIKYKWISVRYHNEVEGDQAIQIHGDIGIAMGNVYLIDIKGEEVVVDKLFVFQKRNGAVRLIVHNSAATNLPKLEKPEKQQGEDSNEQ
jgi:hypothetical protein